MYSSGVYSVTEAASAVSTVASFDVASSISVLSDATVEVAVEEGVSSFLPQPASITIAAAATATAISIFLFSFCALLCVWVSVQPSWHLPQRKRRAARRIRQPASGQVLRPCTGPKFKYMQLAQQCKHFFVRGTQFRSATSYQ